MPCRLPGDESVRWRCLDSLAWALATLACTLYLPQAGRTVLGGLSLLYMVPLVWASGSVQAMREPAGLAGPWQIWRLRAAWLTVVGLAPFFAWWLRCADVPYLAGGAAGSLAAVSWALLETAFLVARVARSRGLSSLALDALSARVAVLYLMVIPVLSLWVTFLAARIVGWATVPGDWLRFWGQIPAWGRLLLLYGPLLALLNLARVLVRASSGLCCPPPSCPPSPEGPTHESTECA